MKKIVSCLLAVFLVLSSAACKTQTEAEYEDSYYGNIVLPAMVSPEGPKTRLPGMVKDAILLPENASFDDTLINAHYAGLFDLSGEEVLYLKNGTEKMYPASVTKIMTALLVLENCRNFDELVTVTEVKDTDISGPSSSASLEIGTSYSVTDLLYGLMIPSGNDAANVLAAHIAGSVPAFVDMMNEKAQSLGMFDTHFANPHGLHNRNHYTTVYDLYLLMKECIKYPMFLGAAGSMEASVKGHRPDGTVFTMDYRSGNSYLLGYTVPPEGVRVRCGKTGYTVQAGRCLVLAVQDTDKNYYISIIGKADSYDNLYLQMNELLSMVNEESDEQK